MDPKDYKEKQVLLVQKELKDRMVKKERLDLQAC